MNEEIKKKWIEALRSGKYEQGRGWLKTQDNITKTEQFCCLGVLCDLHQQVTKTSWDIPHLVGKESSIWSHSYMGLDSFLPSSVQTWAEVTASNPTVLNPVTEDYSSLVYLNDMGTTFSEIADIIEKNL